ncbi:Ptr Secreted-periplasmic Zn-dependent peptidase insulinase [Pyrenophora tritici-repentis]|uniref:Ptr, Secreted-periplasmic Zn-dependent peptidase, insulinase n=1 Tax=Pyrenophora tritici-repentis TaxID=45151 RepID=A0A2W1GFN1_9PLEO|nr:Ptr Secreted-periplasmic Zn-dependent peptidase insulinase [Pyrenophora tritici-repentis]KAF7568543.1 Ptr, Secreted-periplasmic Zn-dependent peptidase, insulinase [Pyrenophora tritici-repentis]PZD33538.1 Ptr, Secretedperiplasmic Zn-dependent peptidase, insulinase-like protein [Pyrenophora tritici-repentis]
MAETLGREAGGRNRIEDLERPQLDDRSYRIITLPNQLEVLLIHEAGTDKASAALDVNVGSFSDAPDMPGIAHAVEHLLFMGTEKYPEENAYNQYLTRHGGYSNAFTASTSTNYYFELSYPSSSPKSSKTPTPDASQVNLSEPKEVSPLWGGLDRFGQFFISPLFLEDTVDRELKAVDSENKKNLQNDTWRMHQLDKALANPDHPYNHFSTGSYKTLHDEPIARGVKIRDEFIKFHSTHYSANRMKLVVLGRESLDTLETWVEEIFSKVPNKDLGKNRWDMPVYTEKELLTQTFARPVLQSRSLQIQFAYRDEEKYYESHPSRYLSHLLGHEGPGSILAHIKAKGWANGLGAGGSTLCPGSGLFTINIKLTEEGLKNYKEVTKLVFQYIGLMCDKPPQEWVVEEQMRISEVEFRFKQKSPPSRTASGLAGIMQRPYERKMLLSGPATIKKFDSELIREALSYLRPDNFRMTIISQDFPGGWDQKEKWYGTEHKVERIPDEFLTEIKQAFESKSRPAELHFPHKNEFIPTRLNVEKKEVEQPTKEPKLIRHDDNVRVWWKKDDQFWVPKANVHIYFRTPITNVTARITLLCTLYRELVNDALVEYAYDADISGLVYDFTNHINGLSITVSGYNDKLHVLLEKVLLQVRDLKVSEGRFNIIHDRMLRSLRNWQYGQPFHQVGTYSRQFKTEKSVMNEELLPELENVTAQDVQQFFPQILAQCQIEVLAHGNLYKEEALKITDLVERTMKPRRLPADQVPTRRGLLWPSGCNFIYEKQLKDPENVNHCIEYSLYAGHNYDSVLRAKLLLLGQMTDEPCFNQLRTIEQLGYVVFSGSSFHDVWSGYRILIQSEKDCRYLEGRIENFLTTFEKTLNEMSEEDFESHKQAMINKRLAKLKNLSSEDNRFWNHIYSDSYDFLQADVDAANLEKLTKKEMVDFYGRYISTSSPHRSKLSVHLQAQSKAKEPSLEEKKTAAVASLKIILAEYKITSNEEAFQTRIKDASSTQVIADAVASHLTEDLKVEKDIANKVLDEAKAALGVADSGLPAAPTSLDTSADVKSVVDASHPVLITDVHAWKAGMQVSTGVRPVRNLEDFVEVAEKL